MKVYITSKRETIKPEIRESIENLGKVIFLEEPFDIEKAPYLEDEEEKILALEPDYYGWNLTNGHIDKIKNLKALCLNTTSYSWLDIEYCKQKGIIVTNVPKYSSMAVAEYAILLMMSCARKLPIQIKSKFKCGYTDEMLMQGVTNKIAGIIGLGAIGSEIAKKCKGLGMNVIYWSRNSRNQEYNYMELEELFAKADYIFPTLISNEETRNIVTDELLNEIKPTSSFISIVHDDLYNHKLLLEKVEKNEMFGYAFEEKDADINGYNGNVMVTCPYAWYTKEALETLVQIWMNSIKGVIEDKIENNVI